MITVPETEPLSSAYTVAVTCEPSAAVVGETTSSGTILNVVYAVGLALFIEALTAAVPPSTSMGSVNDVVNSPSELVERLATDLTISY